MTIAALAKPGLPEFSLFDPNQVLPAVQQALKDFQAVVAACCSMIDPDYANLLGALEATDERLGRTWSTISHMHNVCDSEALREPYAAAQELITRFHADLLQNQALFQAIRSYAEAVDESLDAAQRRVLEHWLRDFRLGGVALEEPARSRFKAISEQLARLATEFEETLLDATDAWSLLIDDELKLSGVPEHAREMFREQARGQGQSGYLLDLRGPSYQAIMTYADARELRQTLYRAYGTRASDQSEHGARFDNGPRIESLLRLKAEAAGLLGFANSAEQSLATKMAPDVATVVQFLADLVQRAKPSAEAELADLQRFSSAKLGIGVLMPWDIAYASEKLKLERFALDDEALRVYFPLERVLQGMLALCAQLFGVRARSRPVDAWHADVRYFDLINARDEVIAGCFFDLYARKSKRGGAWMDVCRQRVMSADLKQVPVAYLNCNFAPALGSEPALLTHEEVLTLFHEFGHGLHHMLTEVNQPSVSGIEGVEWDAVELPSQFMENFCWTEAGLALISGHVSTGAPLPASMLTQLKQTRHFHAGLFLVRQLEFALFDFQLHARESGGSMAEVLSLLSTIRAQVAVIQPPEWHRFPHGFGHIFGGGYGAGYYSYLWAEVLSADAFAAFPTHAPLDPAVGNRFRNEVLAVGGSRPALVSFRAFRGRDPEPAALLESYGMRQ